MSAVLLASQAFSNEKLSTIIVTSATKSAQSIADITSNINVITKEELEEKHINTLQEALNLVSGVQFTSSGGEGATQSVMLRGTSNNRTLILIDGVRYKDHSNINGTNISHIMLNDVERIEVVKGAQSGIWGADAAAGVVNIITKEAKEGFEGSSFVQAGSNNSQQYAAGVSYKTALYDVKLSGNHLKTDSFSSLSPRGEDVKKYEDDPYINTSINAKMGYNFTLQSRLQLNYTRIDAKKDYDSLNTPNNDSLRSEITNNMYSTLYTHELNNHLLGLKYDETRFNREEVGATSGIKKTKGESRLLELNDKWNYATKGFVVVGAGVSKDDVSFEQVSGVKDEKQSQSKFVYATHSNQWNDLILTQSLRHDKYENFDDKTTGKVGAKYVFTPKFNVFSNYGTAYSVPLIIKNLNPWGPPNANLQPEETKSFDMGFEFQNFKATAFYNKVEDLIDWTGGQYINIEGTSKFKGIELEYMHVLSQNLLLNSSFTRLSAKNDEGQNLQRRARFTFKTSLDYYATHALHLNLNASYVGTRYNGVNDTGVQTGRYTVWNGVVNYDINSYMKVYAKLDNITDKIYQIVDGYATPRRSLYVGLKAKF